VRGERKHWLNMAINNAKQALHSHLSNQASVYRRFEALRDLLGLEAIPQRMECFDVSHTSGEATVASCVVFDGDGPKNSEYRRYNIKGITQGDDYAALRKVLALRYEKLKEKECTLPDLVLIDGGKGQLQQGLDVFEELQVTGVTLMSIAKGPGRKAGLETLYVAGRAKPLHPGEHSLALHLLQHIRDEAHRFAITGHRAKRDKRRTESPLQSIEGIGARRRQKLLRHFGGWQEVKRASIEELAKVTGISQALAERIFAALHA